MFKQVCEYIRSVFQTEEFIPLHEPNFKGNEEKYVLETIRSTFVSSVGKFVDDFELKMQEYTGAGKAVAVVNGTSGLHLALCVLGVEKDHEVLTQSLSFVATTNAIHYTGAKPVFIDVERSTLGMSAEKLAIFFKEKTIQQNGVCINKNSGRIIKACVPMHTFGFPCEIDKIYELCKSNNVVLIEDSAESIGSFYKGKHTGTFGDAGVFSFNGNKTITSGGGGLIVFKDEILGERAKFLSTTAKEPHKWEFQHNELGFNYRMPNINAALALAQLERLPEILKLKRELSQKYISFFKNIDSVDFVQEPLGSESNYWLNVVVLQNRKEQEAFLKETNENGIMTRPVWNLLHSLPMNKDCESDDLSNSIELRDRLVNIPSSAI